MRPINYIGILILLLNGIATSGQTCDSMSVCDCASKDLSPGGVMLGHEHGKGTWKISYRYMSVIQKDNVVGTTKVDDYYVFNNYIMSAQNMRMDMHMLMAMYGFSNKFSVMLMFNYNMISMNMTMLPGMTMQMDGGTMVMTANNNNMSTHSSGLGDTKLYAVYTLINHNEHHVFLSEGFNIPTGSIQMKGSNNDIAYSGQRLPYMMQLGSGSWDFLPGIAYLLKENKVSASTQITSVIRPFNNSQNYHLGNEFTLNVWAAYKWFPWMSTSLRIEGNSVGKISGYDPSLWSGWEPSASPLCYGGQSINSFIGLNFYTSRGCLKNNKLFVEYGIPVYQNLNGPQLALKSTLYAGWLISF